MTTMLLTRPSLRPRMIPAYTSGVSRLDLFDRQSLAIMAVAHRAIFLIRDHFQLGSSFLALVDAAESTITRACMEWPVVNDAVVVGWTHAKMERWGRVQAEVNSELSILEYGAVAMTALSDLDDRVALRLRKQRGREKENQKRMALLAPVFPALRQLLDYVDPEGIAFSDYERTTGFLLSLYEILEIMG